MAEGPAIVHLMGFPGVGKLTVAREAARQAAEAGHRLVVADNHLSANAVLSVLDLAAGAPSPEAWALVYEVREVVARAIRDHSPPAWSFAFTNVFTVEGDRDLHAVDRLRHLAEHRSSRYVPVVLTCDVDELVRRAASPGRAEQHKLTDPEVVRAYAERTLWHPADATVLDVTATAAAEAAATVLGLAGLA